MIHYGMTKTAQIAVARGLAEAVAGTVKRTRSLARRQMAWFARDPRIRWVPVGEGGGTTAIDVMLAALTEERSP